MRKAVRHTCESHGFCYWVEEEDEEKAAVGVGEAISSIVGVVSSNSYYDRMSTQKSQDQPSPFEKLSNVLFQRISIKLTCPFP